MSHMCDKELTEDKIEKEGKMSFSIFLFINTIHLAYLKGVHKIWKHWL